MTLKEQLQHIIKGDVSDAIEILNKNSTDASIFQIQPELVVSPHSSEDIKNLVSFVNLHKSEFPHLSLTARAAGTDMSGGPLTESVVLDFLKYFQGVKNIDIDKQEATVLPGTYYRDFEKATLGKGLLLPSYTASKELCTVGGMVANNSGGEKTLTYGKTIDYVRELKIVLSDGNEYVTRALDRAGLDEKIAQNNFEGKIYSEIKKLVEVNRNLLREAKPKVHKNSAGYYLWDVWDGETFDLNKLIVGSQGTLGIITEIKLGLIKPKEHSSLLVIMLDEFAMLSEVVGTILAHKPESFEAYDDHSMKLAVRFMPDMMKQLGAKNLIALGWQFLPEIRLILLGGVPKLILVAEFTGDSEDEIYAKARAAEKDLKKFDIRTHIAKNDKEENKYWTMRRESFNLLRKHVHGKHTAPFIDDIVVLPEHLPKFLPELNALMKDYKLEYTIAGHIGDGNFHIIPLMDFERPDFKQIISELSKKVYDLVGKYGGSITGEHNDGLIRTPFLNRMYKPEILELFNQTKQIFDPLNIFNPGKKTGADLGYTLSHIRHWQ
ncbi:MAG: FAD-binding oxidoreductase [Patescibacteria group bacterium]